jgi:hypothetical protein
MASLSSEVLLTSSMTLHFPDSSARKLIYEVDIQQDFSYYAEK